VTQWIADAELSQGQRQGERVVELTEVLDDAAGGFLLNVAGRHDGVGRAQCRHLVLSDAPLFHVRIIGNRFVVRGLRVTGTATDARRVAAVLHEVCRR